MTRPLWNSAEFPSPTLSRLGMMGLLSTICRFAKTIQSLRIQFRNPPSIMQVLMILNSCMVFMISSEPPLEVIIASVMDTTLYTQSLQTHARLLPLLESCDGFLTQLWVIAYSFLVLCSLLRLSNHNHHHHPYSLSAPIAIAPRNPPLWLPTSPARTEAFERGRIPAIVAPSLPILRRVSRGMSNL